MASANNMSELNTRAHRSKLATIFALAAFAAAIAPPAHAHKLRMLPPEVTSDAPGIHELGRGKRYFWGVKVYHATLWVVGPTWNPAEPHAMELEPGRNIPADSLVDAALDEMHDLNLGDRAKLQMWAGEMHRVVPNVKKGDTLVIFCPASGKTFLYLDNRKTGEVDDSSFCPAIMSIWLHPASSQGELRRALLRR